MVDGFRWKWHTCPIDDVSAYTLIYEVAFALLSDLLLLLLYSLDHELTCHREEKENEENRAHCATDI